MPKEKLNFPFPKDCEVRISDDRFSMGIISSGVIISSCGSSDEDIPVDPACIVIDDEHIYLRRNWKSWHTVDTKNKVLVKKLVKSARCVMFDSIGAISEEYKIPIYKISTFPEKLFRKDELDEVSGMMSEDKKDIEKEIEDMKDSDIVEMLPDKILNCTKKFGVDIIPRFQVDDHCIDLVFTIENVSVFCGIIFDSEDANRAKEKEDDMYYIKDDMLKEAPDAKRHIALVVEDVGCFKPQYETTNILTEDGLIEFLEKIFGNENELEGV